jgi:pyrimidine-nucleoside phosphorylase
MEEAEGVKKLSAPMGLTPLSVIKIKRNNERPHTAEEIKWFVHSFAAAEGAMSNQQQPVRDYQMAAWLMAICLNGMTSEETAALTHAMVHSGVVLPSLASKHVTADKHSTGGVGDKISLLLAPLVASCGVWVPMMAGRGLEHTGGTIDKLESLNMKTTFSVPEFHRLVQTVGCCIASPSQDMCPADRKMYALRDVTGTVVSLPLQTASIMSKKIAENPDTLVLDVKYGIAAFQPVRSLRVVCDSQIQT